MKELKPKIIYKIVNIKSQHSGGQLEREITTPQSGCGRIIREAKRAFFLHFLLYPLISSIKNSTGTKCISTISCRNRKACIFCTEVSHPVTDFRSCQTNIHYRIHLKCIDFGFSQDSYYTENLFINKKIKQQRNQIFSIDNKLNLRHEIKKQNFFSPKLDRSYNAKKRQIIFLFLFFV